MKKKNVILVILTITCIFTLFAFSIHTNKEVLTPPKQKYNILFLFIDDLRPELACYGQSYVKSPNIDALAASATIFDKHFVTVPTCGASRASILSGLLPGSVAETNNSVFEYKQEGTVKGVEPESFVQQLRVNGYYTVGIGKISHSPDGYIYKYLESQSKKMELPKSWDEMLFNAGKWKTGWNAFFGYADGNNRNDKMGSVKPYEQADVDDDGYPDGLTANLAVKKLKQLAKKKQPFFLGVGFFKPHLPFNAPKKYWDMYDEASLPLAPSPKIPQNVNKASLTESEEFSAYKLGDEEASLSKPVSDAYSRKLRHAYLAGVSYVDAQIGKVIDELKRQGLAKNTIIIVWGDHGWHLGDDLVWGKHTLSEWATRSPLIIKVPGEKSGRHFNKVVSSIDVYPTIMDLCGLEMPYPTRGRSLVPILRNQLKPWNEVAYSYFNRGISLRTERYRLTKYFRNQQPTIELYDYRLDPYETINIASTNPVIVDSLTSLWDEGNTGLYNLQHSIIK